MGHNLNLVAMLGLPERVTCPKCGAEAETSFGDYDIDEAGLNPAPGVWYPWSCCQQCEHEWRNEFHLVVEQELEAAFDLADGVCPCCGHDVTLRRQADGWCFGCQIGGKGCVRCHAVTAETLAGVMEKWREAVR